MFRRVVMAATSSSEGKAVILDKVKSPMPAMNKMKAQIRSVNSKSSPVYKSNRDASLVNGMQKLNLRNNTSNKPPTGRNFCASSGKITIKSLSDVASLIRHQQAKNIVVVAGAGISTPSGIPDFRTPGTGLYDNLAQYNIPYPEAIFDIDYFHRNPRPFFTLAKELYPSGKYRPNYIHYFARLLHDKGQLLRMYTQNIDGLERLAGIPSSKLVEAHGTFATATCLSCGQRYSGEDIKDKIFDDKLPRCKRSGCAGTVKPDIVFFGEELPKRFYFYLKDMIQTDLVLVMGTSLEVYPFAGIIDNVRWNIPRVLFNRNAVGPFYDNKRTKDFLAEGDLLETVQKFVKMTEFKEEMAELIIKCEGEFKIASAPPVVQIKNPSKPNNQNDSYVARWRQQARMDLFKASFSFSSSSEEMSSSSESEESSTSSEEEKPKKKRNGQRKINDYSRTKTDVPSRKFSTSSNRRNGATVNPRMLKPLRGEWMKNGSKQPDSCSNREKDAKQRPRSGSNKEHNIKPPLSRSSSKKELTNEKENLSNVSEAKCNPLERENAFIRVSPSSSVASITSRPSAPIVNRDGNISVDMLSHTYDDKNSSPIRKPFVRPLSVSPMLGSVGSQTFVRSRVSLHKAKQDINGRSSSSQKQRTPSENDIQTDSRRYNLHQTAKKNISQFRIRSRRIGSEQMPKLPNRRKQQRTVYNAQILSYTVDTSSTSSSEVSESDDDSR